MPITVNFQGRQPITQDINNAYEITYNPDDFNSVTPNEPYMNTFIANYEAAINTLRSQNISNLPDYTSAIYFGIDLNNINVDNINVDTIKKIKEINEEEINEINEEEKENGTSGRCFNMIKYTRICDSAIMPCKSIIDSIREFDSAIMPCKYIIDSIKQIDSQISIPQKPVVTQPKPKKTGPPQVNGACPQRGSITNGPPQFDGACPDTSALRGKPVVTQPNPKK